MACTATVGKGAHVGSVGHEDAGAAWVQRLTTYPAAWPDPVRRDTDSIGPMRGLNQKRDAQASHLS